MIYGFVCKEWEKYNFNKVKKIGNWEAYISFLHSDTDSEFYPIKQSIHVENR